MFSAQQLLDRLELFGTRLGLERTRRLLARLGSPQESFASVLVAGTNGKGSTAAFLASILSASGYRTGLYTSPHLESVRERIRVDGRSISGPDLESALAQVVPDGSEEKGLPTYFEALTASALVHFERREVDIAVLEVGLGGRLDATNATEPVLSVISEIGLDHQEHLGESLAEIAREKAGILRAHRPAVAGVGEPEARQALREEAELRSTEIRFVDASGVKPPPALLGEHQRRNVALATAAARELVELGWDAIDEPAILRGITATRWPGRLESVRVGARRVLLDGAHNPQGARALARHLDGQPLGYALVFGALADKPAAEMLAPLTEGAELVFLTEPPSPRAVEARRLAEAVPGGTIERSPGRALTAALESCPLVVVCGSLYLVGAIRSELHRRFGVPEPAAELRTYRP